MKAKLHRWLIWPQHTVVLGLAIAAVTMNAGCTGSSIEDDGDHSAGPDRSGPAVPTLLISEGPENAGMEAIVSGTLGINDRECVTIDGQLLIAPRGSEITDDGSTILLTGYPAASIGETFTGTGGYVDELDEAWSTCLDEEDGEVVVVSVGSEG